MRVAGLVVLLSLACAAHPLGWLEGTYHSVDGSSHLEEAWVVSPDNQILGTSHWLEDGAPYLSELLRIQPEGQEYRLDLWLNYATGSSKHITMSGGPSGANQFCFKTIQNGQPESLTYRKDERGHLRVELAKKERVTFELRPGPGPLDYPPVPLGQYQVFTYFSEVPVVDRLRWTQSPDADLGGVLEVPNRFSAPLEKIHLKPGRKVTFELMVPEGAKPFRVIYEIQFSQDMSQAIGTMVDVASGRQLASLVLCKAP